MMIVIVPLNCLSGIIVPPAPAASPSAASGTLFLVATCVAVATERTRENARGIFLSSFQLLGAPRPHRKGVPGPPVHHRDVRTIRDGARSSTGIQRAGSPGSPGSDRTRHPGFWISLSVSMTSSTRVISWTSRSGSRPFSTARKIPATLSRRSLFVTKCRNFVIFFDEI